VPTLPETLLGIYVSERNAIRAILRRRLTEATVAVTYGPNRSERRIMRFRQEAVGWRFLPRSCRVEDYARP
jgi:hypothetical protein